jgi:hypothetical protein
MSKVFGTLRLSISEHIGRRGRPGRDVVYERLDVQIAELR